MSDSHSKAGFAYGRYIAAHGVRVVSRRPHISNGRKWPDSRITPRPAARGAGLNLHASDAEHAAEAARRVVGVGPVVVREDAPEAVVAEERATDKVEDMRRWVSTFERLPLFTTRELQEHTDYDVRVRGRTTPRHAWSFWPWARPSAHGSAGFTFLP